MSMICSLLLHEYEIHRHYHAHEGGEVVPVQGFASEACYGVDGEDHEGYDLLYNLQLEQGERTSVASETIVVGRNHEAVFHQCQTPRYEYDDVQRCVAVQDVHILQLQVSVPCKGHEYVGHDKEENG